MGNRAIKTSLFLLVGAMLAISGCAPSRTLPSQGGGATSSGSGSQTTPSTPVSPDNGKVTLALLVPSSGKSKAAAQLGQSIANAARLGMEDLRDPRVELKVYDTAGNPATAAQMAQNAINDGADIILGPLFGAATRSVSPVASAAGLKVLSFSTDVGVAGGGVWVTGYLPEMEAARVLSYASSQGYKSIGVFYPSTPYGDAAMRGAREAASDGRVQILGSTAFTPGFAGIQEAIGGFASQALGAEAVLIATGGTDLKSAGTFMDYNNFNPRVVKFLGLGQWYSGETLKELTLRGGWFPAPDPVLSNNFSNRYAGKFGGKPPLLAALGYDAVQIAGKSVAAARASNAGDAFAVDVITSPTGYEGALGLVRLTPDGRNQRALAILEVDSRSFRTIDPAPTSFALGF
ncbi:penicillin-binding protein activator [Rhodobacteraceae bacterium NNCM2]|nr:penicillin-binding protein activator [Coraliihabitans acroporae]